MRRPAAWWAVLLVVFGGRAFAHSSPQSIVRLDFRERSIHAEILVPESELAFATAAEPAPTSFEAYLLRHVKAATPEGAPWKVEVVSVRNTSYLDHAYLQADVLMTPPAGGPVRSLVFTDDAVTHEVRSHVIVVLAQTTAAPVMLGALQHPARTLRIDQTAAAQAEVEVARTPTGSRTTAASATSTPSP